MIQIRGLEINSEMSQCSREPRFVPTVDLQGYMWDE